MVSALFRSLNQIVKSTPPLKSLHLMVDGPAPIAKLVTQRERRKRKAKPGVDANEVDSALVTPGTPLMDHLMGALKYWACSVLAKDATAQHQVGKVGADGAATSHSKLRIFLSTSNVPGEGEVKIIRDLRFQEAHVPGGADDSVLIVGGDADLVAMALCGPCTRISIRKDFGGNKMTCIVLGSVKERLEAMFPGHSAEAARDFALIAFTRGNDYLPKLRGTNATRTWASYVNLKKANPNFFLVGQAPGSNDPFIHWGNFAALFARKSSVHTLLPGKGKGKGKGLGAAANPETTPGAAMNKDQEEEDMGN